MSEECSTPLVVSACINIHLSCGHYFVWNAKDVDCLRKNHGIVGALVGCYSLIPKQNSQLGLPLQLSRVQTKFVMEHCNAKLTSCSLSIDDQNCAKLASSINTQRATQHRLQKHIKQEQKADLIESMASEIKAGKIKQIKRQLTDTVTHNKLNDNK